MKIIVNISRHSKNKTKNYNCMIIFFSNLKCENMKKKFYLILNGGEEHLFPFFSKYC